MIVDRVEWLFIIAKVHGSDSAISTILLKIQIKKQTSCFQTLNLVENACEFTSQYILIVWVNSESRWSLKKEMPRSGGYSFIYRI